MGKTSAAKQAFITQVLRQNVSEERSKKSLFANFKKKTSYDYHTLSDTILNKDKDNKKITTEEYWFIINYKNELSDKLKDIHIKYH